MNNYWDTNYRAGQGGHFTFHYVVTSAQATDPAALSHMGWEEATPLETDTVTSQDKALGAAQAGSTQAAAAHRLDASQQGFLEMDDPNLLLETWKPAEDGQGSILRFLDLGGAERMVSVRTPLLQLGQVTRTDSLERGAEAVTLAGSDRFQFTVHPHEIVTLRLVP
jgi:alpha-mannosidase